MISKLYRGFFFQNPDTWLVVQFRRETLLEENKCTGMKIVLEHIITIDWELGFENALRSIVQSFSNVLLVGVIKYYFLPMNIQTLFSSATSYSGAVFKGYPPL